jgi:hypothetical protein
MNHNGRKVLNLKKVGDDLELFARLPKMSTLFETAEMEHSELVEI